LGGTLISLWRRYGPGYARGRGRGIEEELVGSVVWSKEGKSRRIRKGRD